MNNTKLEVVRINEDVIATSGVCSHPSTTHYFITDDTNPAVPHGYYFKENVYQKYKGDTLDIEGVFDLGAAKAGKWYYEVPGDGAYECNGTHSNYTIIEE